MITLSMIVKNEEKYLRDCLDSVKGVVDEIVLVDTGSTDNTVKIAEEFGAKIFNYTWKNDFADARNFALSKSSCGWILYLDADERLNKSSIQELKKITQSKDKKGYNCRIVNIDEVSKRPSVMSYVRLFANIPGISFEGKVHEQIANSLISNGYEIKSSAVEIIHVGYNLSKEELKKKAGRNLDILLEEYKLKKNGYNAFQIGQTLHILGREEEAVDYFKASLNDLSLRGEYRGTAYRSLAVYSADNFDFVNAEDFINYSLSFDPQQPLSLLAASKIYLKNSKFNEAVDCVKNALKYNKAYMTGKKVSSQNILLDQKVIIYNGLNTSLIIDDYQSANYFLEEWKREYNDSEYKFFNLLLNRKSINTNSFDLSKLINGDNIELLFTVVNRYPDKKVILNVVLSVADKFSSNSFFLSKYGLLLMECALYEESEKALEQSLQLNPHEYSSIFYIISVYIYLNKFEKIIPTIDAYRHVFKSNPEMHAKITALEKKLKHLA